MHSIDRNNGLLFPICSKWNSHMRDCWFLWRSDSCCMLLCSPRGAFDSTACLQNCHPFSRTIREKKVNCSQTLGSSFFVTSAIAVWMIDSSFISQRCGITQWEHINHHLPWQLQCTVLCFCFFQTFSFLRVTLLLWQATINHVDWQHW